MKLLAAAAVAVVSACMTGSAPPANPTPQPQSLNSFAPVIAYLQSQVDSAFPGAVLAVGHRGAVVLLAGVGHHGQDDARPVTPETIYDLASLTKVIGLTTACMLLVEAGTLDLDAPVQRYLPAFAGPAKEKVTVRHLLTHSSGLPAWRPLFTEATTRASAFALADTTPLASSPGSAMVYSDLGAIVLTQIVERISGERLDALLERRLFGPLRMTRTRYLPPTSWLDRIAPTERSQDGTVIRGTVHDENAWRLGGVSGHAGLFSTAPDLARFAQWLLDAWHGRRTTPEDAQGTSGDLRRLSATVVRDFTSRQNLPPGSSRALGWDTPSGVSSAGTRLGPRAFGHTGFTGTSIWIDPDRELFIILLSNRVHPTRENARILRIRPRVADLVVEALAAEAP